MTPGAGLHVCFPDAPTGDRPSKVVLHGDLCRRCGAKFAIEAAGGATTRAEVVALVQSKADADLWVIGFRLEPKPDASGEFDKVAVTVACKDLKRWLAVGGSL